MLRRASFVNSELPSKSLYTHQHRGSRVLDILGDGSCVALYRFEGNLNDESGNHNGIMFDGSEEYTNGRLQQGLHIYGSTDTKRRCKLPDNFNSELGGKSGSISAWLKIEEFIYNSSYVNLVTGSGSYTTSDFSQLNITISENHGSVIKCQLRDDSNNGVPGEDSYHNISTQSFAPQLNVWYHVVSIWDKDQGKLFFYLNGNLFDSVQVGTGGFSSNSGSDFSFIGNHPNGWYNSVVYDQVRIFNRPLTQEEIQVLYEER